MTDSRTSLTKLFAKKVCLIIDHILLKFYSNLILSVLKIRHMPVKIVKSYLVRRKCKIFRNFERHKKAFYLQTVMKGAKTSGCHMQQIIIFF